MPKDRKDFARMLNVAVLEVSNMPRFTKIPLKAILAFREPHQNGHHHYHGILISEAKVWSWKEVANVLLRHMSVKAHMCTVNVGRGGDPVNRILRYVMVPRCVRLKTVCFRCVLRSAQTLWFLRKLLTKIRTRTHT